jgi:peptide/nickel transport system ATP-binding protein
MQNSSASTNNIVLDVDNVQINYETRKGDVEAIQGVSFKVREGETVGLVGESGCGKSTIAFGIVNFLGPNGKIVEGSIRFQGDELVGRSEEELKKLRGDRISMVFQDPMQALNPSVRLGEQLAEVLTCHRDISQEEAWEKSIQMLKRVNMPDVENVMVRYSHQISGGQQQRVVIAMAMLNNPALIIMDEPTTALDVTVEAAVLDLLEELKNDFNAANIFITHNLGVVARVSDYLCVMYAGQMVESGPLTEIFHDPRHPYTMGLLACVPRLGDSKLESLLHPIRGRVPPPAERSKTECIFAPRCEYVTEDCRKARPGFTQISSEHLARCIYATQIQDRARTRKRKKAPEAPAQAEAPREDLLSFEHLKVYYPQESNSVVSLFGMGEKKFVKAVDDVSVRVAKGRTLGIVGESGCGKSSLVKGLIGLEPVTDGDVQFMGIDTTKPVTERDTNLIKEMQMVFQNPDSTLNPSFTVGSQIARPIRRFKTAPRNQVKDEVIKLLKAVRLPPTFYDRLPRQLSGGEKQVFGSSMIFIAHDLSVVRFFSDDIAVMYLGQIVEVGPADAIYDPPYHPYTEALLSAVPIPDPDVAQKEIRLSGNVPSALDPPSGCRFHTRCPRRHEMVPDEGKICEKETPPWQDSQRGHRILCHIPIEELAKIDPVVNVKAA